MWFLCLYLMRNHQTQSNVQIHKRLRSSKVANPVHIFLVWTDFYKCSMTRKSESHLWLGRFGGVQQNSESDHGYAKAQRDKADFVNEHSRKAMPCVLKFVDAVNQMQTLRASSIAPVVHTHLKKQQYFKECPNEFNSVAIRSSSKHNAINWTCFAAALDTESLSLFA